MKIGTQVTLICRIFSWHVECDDVHPTGIPAPWLRPALILDVGRPVTTTACITAMGTVRRRRLVRVGAGARRLDGERHEKSGLPRRRVYSGLGGPRWPTSASLPIIRSSMAFTRTAIRLIGGKLFTYQAGTSTPAAAYHDAAATMPHQNPIVARRPGRSADPYDAGDAVETPYARHDVELWVVDNIGIGWGGGRRFRPRPWASIIRRVRIGLVALGGTMSRLFYHVMQDNVGNLFSMSPARCVWLARARWPRFTGTKR